MTGIDFTSRQVLRWGVALLGLRITGAQVMALGWQPLVIVGVSLMLTIGLWMVVARLIGFNSLFGLLSGGATAICGASAALALSAALPPHPLKERATLFTVIGISALSTTSMILYPTIMHMLGLNPHMAGVFLGATIHDVAQVVGAGYSISKEVGDTATLVKLLRVACLLPVILFAVTYTRVKSRDEGKQGDGPRSPLLPWFAVGFAVLVAINSTGYVPKVVADVGISLSGWCLAAAMVGIGMKTQLRELAAVGIKPVVLMVGETVFLVCLVLAMLKWGHLPDEIHIVCELRCETANRERVRELALQFVEPARAEEGCLYYNLHQKLDEPNTFCIIDGWANQMAVDSHAKNAHVASVMKELGPLLSFGPSLTFTSRVSD